MNKFADIKDVLPTPRIIGGVEMRPFCLGHHLLFKWVGLPFAGNPDADCGEDDIIRGISICGMDYQAAFDAVYSGRWPEIIASWRKQVQGPWWRPTQLDMEATESAFRVYLQDGYAMPPVWTRAGHALKMGAPWELILKLRLMESGMSEAEALNGYLPARWFDYFTAMELQAADNCVDPAKWHNLFYTEADAEMMK